jgi:hypothetical protein
VTAASAHHPIVAGRRRTAPVTACAFLASLLLLFLLHVGYGFGVGGSASPLLGAGDAAIARHAAVLRDGPRPVVAAEHGDRTSAPPPSSPAALVIAVTAPSAPAATVRASFAIADIVAGHRIAGHRPRAPPIAA